MLLRSAFLRFRVVNRGFPAVFFGWRADTACVPVAIAFLTLEQREFAEVHAIGLVEQSFVAGSVFMYRDGMGSTDRWLVGLDGFAAEHDRFERE